MTGMDLTALKAKHDRTAQIVARVNVGLKALGANRCEYEGDFIKRCKMAVREWALVRGAFAAQIVLVKEGYGVGQCGGKRRVVCGSVAFAKRAKQEIPGVQDPQ